MLSLEVNLDEYQDEIKHAIGTYYTTYWLEQHFDEQQQREEALQSAIKQKTESIENLRSDVRNAVNLIDDLEDQNDRIKQESTRFRAQLKKREGEIAEQFRKDEETRRIWLAVIAGVRSATDLFAFSGGGQDGKKGGGGKLGLLMAVGAGAAGIESYMLNEAPQVSDGAASAVFDDMFEQDGIEAARERLARLQPTSSDAGAFVGEILAVSEVLSQVTEDYLKEQIAEKWRAESGAEFEAWDKLKRILDSDDEFQKTFRQLVLLMTQKQLFAQKLADATQAIENGIIEIAEAVEIIDKLQAAKTANKVEPYLRESFGKLRRETKQRLIRTRYFFAKAYEYRMLKACPIDYAKNRIFERLADLSKQAETGGSASQEVKPFQPSSDHIKRLTDLYLDDLRAIVSRTVSDVNAAKRRALMPVPRELTLSESELRQLNEHGVVRLDLQRRGVVSKHDENSRLASVNVMEHTTVAASGENLSVYIIPGRQAIIRSGGTNYAFSYGRYENVEPVRWGYNWSAHTQRTQPIFLLPIFSDRQSAATKVDQSADYFRPGEKQHQYVRKILAPQERADLTYFRPGAVGDLVIRKVVTPDGSDIQVEQLTLELVFHLNLTKK